MWTPLQSQRRAAVFVVAALRIAFAVDWFLVPWSYPIAAIYVVSFLIAASRSSLGSWRSWERWRGCSAR